MTKTIHSDCSHTNWNKDISPVIRIRSGETVVLHMKEASNDQITPESDVSAVENLDLENVNPVTGPVYVEDAEPGDALQVKILELIPSGWGWTANIPDFGLLAEDFPEAELHIWKYDAERLTPAMFGNHAAVPLKPFIGTLGVAPSEPGKHTIIPPRRVGGNMDIREIAEGSTVIFPVECEGALFSAGDTHAAQGDGEVCGTAIESQLNAVIEITLLKDQAPKFPRVITKKPASRHLDQKGYEITTGIGPDLMMNAKNALRGMIDLLSKEHNMPPVQAYMLCSVCADLRISEIVNEPNFVVSCYFPRIVFE